MRHSILKYVGYIKVLVLRVVSQRHAINAGVMAAVTSITLCIPLGGIQAQENKETGYTSAHRASDHSRWVSADEVSDALADLPEIVMQSDQMSPMSDDVNIMKTAKAGATTSIPRQPRDGVTFGAHNQEAPKIHIELPGADQSSVAKNVAAGTVAYEGANGSANAVQLTEDGGVRMLTVVDSSSAPTAYAYKVTVPNGGHISLMEDGSAIVLSAAGDLIATVTVPWAKDATGAEIETWFTTDGLTLTQHVSHNVTGVVYPVTADPFWSSAFTRIKNGVPTFSGRRIVKCMAGAMVVGTAAIIGVVAAPVTLGASTATAIVLIGGTASYVNCYLE